MAKRMPRRVEVERHLDDNARERRDGRYLRMERNRRTNWWGGRL